MKQIVFASNNKGKINEVKAVLKDYDILSISDMEKMLNKKIIVTENGKTFKANALKKTISLYNQIGDNYLCIGDDSGISIDYLNGFPGVYTARWLDRDDHFKNLELLKKLKGVLKEKRTCHYTTVIALKGKNIIKTFEYTLDGVISDSPRGENGFGFDEIFELSNGLTLSEIKLKEKVKISPRKKALMMIKMYLDEKN